MIAKKIAGFLIGAHFFATAILAFALYVSTFFIFNTKENKIDLIWDFKLHGIILSGLMSVLSGGMINQFYDREKDKVVRPFFTQLQSFIQQKTFLIGYLILGLMSLLLAFIISFRVFIFYLIFQFLIWVYSHKLSRILIVNNLLFVGISLYPFFGMVVYFEAYNITVFLLALYLFFLLLMIDLLKDIISIKADIIFGYHTIASTYGIKAIQKVVYATGILVLFTSIFLGFFLGIDRVLYWYFFIGVFFILFLFILLWKIKYYRVVWSILLIKIWIFVGIIGIATDGFFLTKNIK